MSTLASLVTVVQSYDVDPSMPLEFGAKSVRIWDIMPGVAAAEKDGGGWLAAWVIWIFWHFYLFVVGAAAFLVDIAFSMQWLDYLALPFREIATNLRELLRQWNLNVVMLTISAFICFFWIARGKWGQGLTQLLISLVIANYAIASIGSSNTQVEAWNPLEAVIGSSGNEDGLLYDTRDIALEVGNELMGQDDEVEGLSQDSPGRNMAEVFIFDVAMLIHFGERLTGECRAAYAVMQDSIAKYKNVGDTRDALDELRGAGYAKDGLAHGLKFRAPRFGELPWDYLDDINDNVDSDELDMDVHPATVAGACQRDDPEYYMTNISPGASFMMFVASGPSSFFLLILIALVVILGVFLPGVNAMFQAIKLLWSLLVACVPGLGRDSLWKTVSSALSAFTLLFFGIVFFQLVLRVIMSIVYAPDLTLPDGSNPGNQIGWVLARSATICAILITFIILFWKSRFSIEEARGRIAGAISAIFGGDRNIGGDTRPIRFASDQFWWGQYRDTYGYVNNRAARHQRTAIRPLSTVGWGAATGGLSVPFTIP